MAGDLMDCIQARVGRADAANVPIEGRIHGNRREDLSRELFSALPVSLCGAQSLFWALVLLYLEELNSRRSRSQQQYRASSLRQFFHGKIKSAMALSIALAAYLSSTSMTM
jgi:hypothetical protein